MDIDELIDTLEQAKEDLETAIEEKDTEIEEADKEDKKDIRAEKTKYQKALKIVTATHEKLDALNND